MIPNSREGHFARKIIGFRFNGQKEGNSFEENLVVGFYGEIRRFFRPDKRKEKHQTE
jgi:hypothetical protein